MILAVGQSNFGEAQLYGFDASNGSQSSPLFTKTMDGVQAGHPLITNLDGSSHWNLAAATYGSFDIKNPKRSFYLHVWESPSDINSGDWPMYMHDGARTNASVLNTLGVMVGNNGKLATFLGNAPLQETLQVNPFGTSKIESVRHGAYGPSPLWVAAGDAGKTAWSNDGVTWQQGTSGFGTQSIFGIDEGYLPGGVGLWVITGGNGKIAVSLDGKAWNSITNSTFGTKNIRAVDYSSTGLAGSSGLWVAVGGAGKLATSEDGLNWTQRPTGVPQSILYTVKHNGLPNLVGGRWVAGGENGKALTSLDGVTWTLAADLGDFTIHDIAYNNGLWVLGGGKGKIYTSTDGISWIPRVSGFGSTNTIYALHHNQLPTDEGMWIAGGENGKMATSKDGIIWITSTSSFGTSDILDIAF